MTKKERTIRACRQLAAKYREPEGGIFFDSGECPTCIVHNKLRDGTQSSCLGCPLCGEEEEGYGCGKFKSYEDAWRSYGEDSYPNPAFEARAAFFDKIIPILEKIPASRFTKKGWKYFDELDRSW